MQVVCSRCAFVLSYAGSAPRFCSNCGQALNADPPPDGAPRPQAGPTRVEGTRVEGPGWTPAQPGGVERGAGDRTVAFPGPSGPTPEPPPLPTVPDEVGGYRLLRPLGGGGMGTVYEAVDERTGRHVALKLIRPEFANSSDALERFRREGKLASTIAHPRCVFVLAADEEAGRPYIVMELMPGANLHDLVTRRGPLPVAEAVQRTLDVIEGLQEAHRCGVLHRDVKPSNCFLDGEGRIKVGDFGLSKSLVNDVQLTRTGAFLGTLLFAAPEQIRNEQVDHLADVYSVSATLYFLLTGRAPFEGGDPASTLARTVTDPLTPLRHHRADLPATLDEVVLKGLARPRGRRWQSLEDLRVALLPFVPGSQTLGDLGLRCAAYVADWVLLIPLELVVNHHFQWLAQQWHPAGGTAAVQVPVSFLAALSCGLLYFGLTEWMWGCSGGKFLLGLRVRTERACDRPSLLRTLWRTTCFYSCKDGPAVILWVALMAGLWSLLALRQGVGSGGVMVAVGAVALLPALGAVGGLLLPALTMRRRNGYRGLHELASGTRTIRLPVRRATDGLRVKALEFRGTLPPGLPARVGAFEVRAALSWGEAERVLLAEDPALQRRVWVWLRRGAGPLPGRRPDVSRVTRARWVSGGGLDDWTWDAFVATPGCRLGDLVGKRRLSWPVTLDLLTSLAEELTTAETDGTRPARLGVDQVWLQPGGRVVLLDAPLQRGQDGPSDGSLELLRDVARLALEGRPDPARKHPARDADSPGSPRAPLPPPARKLLGRLFGAGAPLAGPRELLAGLEQLRENPPEVPRPRRALGLAMQGVLLAVGLTCLFAAGPLVLAAGYVLNLYGSVYVEESRREVQFRQVLTAAALAVQPDPLSQPAWLAWLRAEEDELRRLEDRAREQRRERDLMLRSTSWFIRKVVEPAEEELRDFIQIQQINARWEAEQSGDTRFASRTQDILGLPTGVAEDLVGEPWLVALLLAAWPALWVGGAALFRGGPSLRIAGISVVQRDGRRAARWRCALRTALVWLPVWLLLLASLGADLYRVAALSANPDLEAGWTAWVSWLAWWLAAALVACYPWVALRWPVQAPHDVLTGTYLVPR